LKKRLAICAGLWLLGLGTAGTAGAQTVYARPGYAEPGYAEPSLPDPALPPYEIMSIVRSTGLAPLTRPMRRGPYYVLVAVDRVGRQMRVVVDARLGDIVNLRPAVAAAFYGPEPGSPGGLPAVSRPADMPGAPAAYGSRPGADNAPPPVPPRSIPNARAVIAPGAASPPLTHLAVAEPALPPPPPLPRPRPKLALNEAPGQMPVQAPAEAPAGGAVKPPAPAVAPPSAAPRGAGDVVKPIE
jgi:hypothetical protein